MGTISVTSIIIATSEIIATIFEKITTTTMMNRGILTRSLRVDWSRMKSS